MKRKRLLVVTACICLILVLVALLLPACAKESVITPGATTPAATTPAPKTPAATTPTTIVPTIPAPTKPAPTPAAKVYTWKWQASGSPGTPDWDGYLQASDLISMCTDGRLKVEVYPAGALASQIDILDAVKGNAIQIGTGYGGYWKNFIPEVGIDTIPWVWRTEHERFALTYQYGVLGIMQEALAEYNVAFWAPTAGCYRAVIASRPIRTLSDWKGIKLRAVGDMATLFTALGAAPAPLAHEETYMALQLKTIDAYDCYVSYFVTYKSYEVCKYLMLPATNPVNGGAQLVSLKALGDLPVDLANVFRATSQAAGHIDTWRLLDADSFARSKLASLGVETVQMDKSITDLMEKEALRILQSYSNKTPRCTKIIDIIMNYRKAKELGQPNP